MRIIGGTAKGHAIKAPKGLILDLHLIVYVKVCLTYYLIEVYLVLMY